MYTVVENVIKQGGYNLNDIILKIDTLWVNGSLDNEERDWLISLARSSAKTENSFDVFAKLDELEKRVRTLEKNTDTPTDTEEFPEYQDGKWYYTGDKCSFEGVDYVCIAPDGVVCVWSPSAYPTYWEKA